MYYKYICLGCVQIVLNMCMAFAKQPNIIYILADDLGFNDIGYHNAHVQTPVLDELAREGVILENYYVHSVCTPSRGAFFTGRNAIELGLVSGIVRPAQNVGISTEIPFLTDQLKAAGYATHAVGKWHVGFSRWEYTPIRRGFDTFLGHYTGNEDHFTHVNKNAYDLRDGEETFPSTLYSTELYTERVLQIVQQHDTSQPLFMYVSFSAPHYPLQARQKYLDLYPNVEDQDRRTYLAMVSDIDQAVGQIVSACKEAGLWQDTVLVFASDNGGYLSHGGSNLPLRGEKRTLYEGGVRGVAFVISDLLTKTGYVNKEFMFITDWYPTFMRLAGSEVTTQGLEGFDQWDTISSNVRSPRRDAVLNINPVWRRHGKRLHNDSFDNTIQAGLISDGWKLLTGAIVQYAKSPICETSSNIELYNILEDPLEQNEISADHPDKLRELLDLLEGHYQTAVPAVDPPDDPRADPALHGGYWSPWLPDIGEKLS